MGEKPVKNLYSRREFLKSGGATLAGLGALGLAGCGAGAGSSSPNDLTLMVWASTAEEVGFRAVIESYTEQNPDVNISLDVIPFDNYVKLNTLLAAGLAPDLVRVQYQLLGRYSSTGVFAELSDYLEPGYGDAFTPAIWSAVNYEGRPYALPHHTDTMAIFYNTEMFDSLGVEVPESLDESWTWEEFTEVSREIKESGEAPYPFAMAWQDVSSAYRWMWYLFQNGGQLLDDDLSGPAVDSPEGVETIEWHKSWFDEGLVPPNTSIKSSQEIEALFANGTTAMMLNGNWLIPFLEDSMTAGWDVTYMVREAEMAADLGGNGVAVTRDCENRELAADFLKFLASEEEMERFCVEAQFIPTRTSLVERGLDYTLRPEQMNRFVEQSSVVPPKMAEEQSAPGSSQFTQVLGDQLELAFRSGQSAWETASKISDGITEIFERQEAG